ncbi:long-chain fatty acid--CoA ligase [Pantoea sp. Bo_7]|uniref:AMP-binding protein n=1 Tax=unclassified Pantoea TaxID=2630326 RepID=UPI001232D493|nr:MULTISPECIES: AMP-binding protein [unclassified Pantoea]KAA6044442.1 long-chain fatty acid--CoA ligase [Pantoea sp. Bo_7]KAA6090219.1 long-chain fatty acid--CoA ligase [Pantoea sp. Bo_10]
MLIDALASHARHQPDATALVNSQRSWTWRDYEQAVSRFAAELKQAGVRRLGLALENGPEWLIADLACLKASVVCVPVPSFFSQQQRTWVAHSAGLDGLLGSLCPAGWRSKDLSLGQLHICRSAETPPLHQDTVKITYTSGTTGQPKGVCLTLKGVEWTASVLATQMLPLALNRHLVVLPLSTLLENICGGYVPLLLGVTTVVPAAAEVGFTGSSQFSPDIFAGALMRWHPQSLVLVPELLRVLSYVHHQLPAATQPLKFIAAGGGKIAAGVLRAARQAGLPVYEGYGLSECGSVVALNLPEHVMDGSAGCPLPGIDVANSATGSLLVASPGNAAGYLGDAPFEKWIDTGDLAGQDAGGFIHITGRARNVQITAFGRNFSPEWIEAEALSCPAVRRIVMFGEGLKQNVALVDAFAGNEALAREQLEALSATLPDYARPHHLIFTPLISSPEMLTANGRPRRDAIWTAMKDQIVNCEEYI